MNIFVIDNISNDCKKLKDNRAVHKRSNTACRTDSVGFFFEKTKHKRRKIYRIDIV